MHPNRSLPSAKLGLQNYRANFAELGIQGYTYRSPRKDEGRLKWELSPHQDVKVQLVDAWIEVFAWNGVSADFDLRGRLEGCRNLRLQGFLSGSPSWPAYSPW